MSHAEHQQLWMDCDPGAGSVSGTATTYGREHGIAVIDGGCPLMFEPTADLGHKIMRVIYRSQLLKTIWPLMRVAQPPVHPMRELAEALWPWLTRTAHDRHEPKPAFSASSAAR